MAFLELKDVSVSYGAITGLAGVSLVIEKGQIVTIIGANGAGKSTLLNAISGIVKRTGTILFEDKPLPTASHKVVKLGIIQSPEGRRVFAGLSVAENLRIGAYLNRNKKEVDTLLKEQYELFPVLFERKNQMAGTLSGGEQQMLAICRGLMAKPRILLLDEPSLGLAPIVVETVFSTIQKIRDLGITVVLVEQNAKKSLQICDFAYVIENGKISLSGTGQELLQNPDVAESYLGSNRGK